MLIKKCSFFLVNAFNDPMAMLVYQCDMAGVSMRYAGIVFNLNNKSHVATLIYSTCPEALNDPALKTLITTCFSSIQTVLVDCKSFTQSDITVIQKYDEIFVNLSDISCAHLYDVDSLGVTLKDFLIQNFLVDASVCDSKNTAPVYYAARKNPIDWNEFWNSKDVPDSIKAVCKTTLDMNAWYSDRHKSWCKVVDRYLGTQSNNVDCPKLLIISGSPASGKTTYIEKVYAPLHNIPLMCKTGSPKEVIKNFFSQIVPAWNEHTKTNELSYVLTALGICAIYNVPLMVEVDESDLLDLLQLGNLASVQSDGHVNIGGVDYHFDPSKIIWVCTYNPGSKSTCNMLYGKFADRGYKVHALPLTNHEKVAYQNARVCPESIYVSECQKIFDKFDEDISKFSNYSSELSYYKNIALKSFSRHLCSPESLSSFHDFAILSSFPPLSFNFNCPDGWFDYHQGDKNIPDVQTKSCYNKLCKANESLIEFVSDLNTTLYTSSHGRDKNDRHGYIYIPDRQISDYIDLVMVTRDVIKATDLFVSNLIPNDTFECNSSDTDRGFANDVVLAIHTAHDAKMKKLNSVLFSGVSLEEGEKQLHQLFSLPYPSHLLSTSISSKKSSKKSSSTSSSSSNLNGISQDDINNLSNLFKKGKI